jgi:parallel beta-helix repeat protein
MQNRRKIAVTIAFLVLITAFSLEMTNQYGKYDSFNDVDNMLLDFLSFGKEKQTIVGMPIGILDYGEEEHPFEGLDYGFTENYNPYLKNALSLYNNNFNLLYYSGFLHTSDDESIEVDNLANLISLDSSLDFFKNHNPILGGQAYFPGTRNHLFYMFNIFKTYNDVSDDFSKSDLLKINFENRELISEFFSSPTQSSFDLINDHSLFKYFVTYSSIYDSVFIKNIFNTFPPGEPETGFSNLLQDFINNDYNMEGLVVPGNEINPTVPFAECVDLLGINGDLNPELSVIKSLDQSVLITPICFKEGGYVLNDQILASAQESLVFVCEPGTEITMGEEGVIVFTSQGSILAGCTFRDSTHEPIVYGNGNNFDMEVFGNTFLDNDKSFRVLNLQPHPVTDPSTNYNPNLIVIGNTFENSDSSGKAIFLSGSAADDLEIEGFKGNVLITKNLFHNTNIFLKGYQDEASVATIIDNEFTKNSVDYFNDPVLWIKDISLGLVFGNTFTEVDNAIKIEDSESLMVVDNDLNLVKSINNGIMLDHVSNSILRKNSIKNSFTGLFSLGDEINMNINNVFIENLFENNDLDLKNIQSQGTTIVNNDFINGDENNIYITNSIDTIFYENNLPSVPNFIKVINTENSYFYGTNNNYVNTADESQAHFFYPIEINVKDSNHVLLDNAQVIVEDVNGNFVSKYLTGSAGWAINEDIYYYSFTKDVNGILGGHPEYQFRVTYGLNENGEPNIIQDTFTIDAESQLLEKFTKTITYDVDCISLPLELTFQFKSYDPVTEQYVETLEETIINPTDEYVNMYITEDTTFCPGIYELSDGYNVPGVDDVTGAIIIAEEEVTITCDDTVFVGSNNDGAGLYSDKNNFEIEGCTFKNYDVGMLIEGSTGNIISKNNFIENDKGLQLNQEEGVSVQATITDNLFENNNLKNLYLIDPADSSPILSPSLIYHNNFKSINENGQNVYIGGLTNLDDPYEEVRLFKCDEWVSETNTCNGGSGNYWAMQPISADIYLNYKLPQDYVMGVDNIGCPKVNQCDGFYDLAFNIQLNDDSGKFINDQFPFTSTVSSEDFIETNAVLELEYQDDNNLNAELTTDEELDGVSYNWKVDNEPLALINLFFDKLGEETEVDFVTANILKDFSGNDNHAAVYGKPAIASDCVGNCFDFDGIDDQVLISPQFNGSFTIEFLMNHQEDDSLIFANKVMPSNDPNFDLLEFQKNYFTIELNNHNNIIAKFHRDINGEDTIGYKFMTSLTPNVWHHVGIIFDKENNKLFGVLDGNMEIINYGEEFEFDGLGDEGNYKIISGVLKQFNGKIDEFKIYDQALPVAQIINNNNSYFIEEELVRAPISNILHRNQHDSCGLWTAEAYVTKDDLLLDLTTNLDDSFDLPCGKTICTPEGNECEAPQVCGDTGYCGYQACEGDGTGVCDIVGGEMCEFNKCIMCTDLSGLQDTLIIEEDTVICGDEFNFHGWPDDKPLIEIKENNTQLKCMDETEIVGPSNQTGVSFVTLFDTENVKIENCKVSNFARAIAIEDSLNIELKNNVLFGNSDGLWMRDSDGIYLFDNIIKYNIVGVNSISIKSIDFVNTNLTNQVNLVVVSDACESCEGFDINDHILDYTFEKCYLNESVFIKEIDILSEPLDMFLTSLSGSKIKFKDSYYDLEDVHYEFDEDYEGDLEYNAELQNYWTLDVNVIDTADSSQSIPNVGIEILKDDQLIDLNENGIENELDDIIITDEEGWASTYLLGNKTDKDGIIETAPEYIVKATNPFVPNAVAISDPFTMMAPKTIILDLEAGEEFKINTNTIDQISQNSGSSSGGKKGGGCSPQFNDTCKKKYDTTPCVIQGDMNYSTKIYTCISNNGCGTILFVEPCEGNAPSFSSSCNNQVRDLLENGVDCGGPCSNTCAATCDDKKKNQDESDVDCGGKCSKCLDNYDCYDDLDCVSGYCGSGVCKQATCYDNVKNQDEEQVDCGGSVCVSCSAEEPTCYDNVKNQGEEQVDCGGPCEACQPILQEPKGFSYYWLLLLLIPMLAGLLGAGYLIYNQGHKTKKIPPMGGLSAMRDKLIPPMNKGVTEEVKHLPPIGITKNKELKREIKSLLEKGKKKHEIIERLKLKYPEERIKLVFEQSLHDVLPKKYEQQLKKYINHYYAKGLSKSALKSALIEAGWSKKIVNKMVK